MWDERVDAVPRTERPAAPLAWFGQSVEVVPIAGFDRLIGFVVVDYSRGSLTDELGSPP